MSELFVLANQIEAGLWIVIGLGFAAYALTGQRSQGRRSLVTAVTFVAFGASDIVETHTGAWWRPWWLLVWKAVCVATLLRLLYRHVRDQRRARAEQATAPSTPPPSAATSPGRSDPARTPGR